MEHIDTTGETDLYHASFLFFFLNAEKHNLPLSFWTTVAELNCKLWEDAIKLLFNFLTSLWDMTTQIGQTCFFSVSNSEGALRSAHGVL